jgi:HAD superfamily hydrolase (TIGR01509 family)
VILDSGDVLIRPVSGRWYPAPAFEEVLEDRQVAWRIDGFPAALEVAGQWLNEIHAVPLADEAEERLVWVRYYELVLESLGFDADRHELAETIATAWEATLWVEPFPWTLPVLRELEARGIPVVVLSDAWPSLRRWFRELGLDAYVDAMVISGEEGITKPDRRAFDKARALLDANDIVFVDDSADNVRGAIALGMRGLRLGHPGKTPDPTLTEISDLHELLTHV